MGAAGWNKPAKPFSFCDYQLLDVTLTSVRRLATRAEAEASSPVNTERKVNFFALKEEKKLELCISLDVYFPIASSLTTNLDFQQN